MSADFRKLVQSLQGGKFAPVYLIDGDEPYYLDLIIEYMEDKILTPAERDFNLMVLYGKDADWADVVNACRRFPMFAERQVVILKDAAQMKTLGELEAYVENPSPTTVFLIEHRFKKADGRSRLLKAVKEKGVYFTSEKIKDEQVPHWIQAFGKEQGLQIGQGEAETLTTHLGSDLQKIANEIAKVRINMPDEKVLTAQHIQRFIGISREYNVFDFPEALTSGNKDKLYRMLSYFLANPKSAPMPLLIGAFYNHLEALYLSRYLAGKSDKEINAVKNAWAIKKVMNRKFSLAQVESCLLLLATFSTQLVGVRSNTDNGELLKEFVGKMELTLGI